MINVFFHHLWRKPLESLCNGLAMRFHVMTSTYHTLQGRYKQSTSPQQLNYNDSFVACYTMICFSSFVNKMHVLWDLSHWCWTRTENRELPWYLLPYQTSLWQLSAFSYRTMTTTITAIATWPKLDIRQLPECLDSLITVRWKIFL